jgi:ketosteroid isomerase-like protein
MATRSAPEQEVWERELASWERLKAADLTGYLSLLHDDVMVWPTDRPAPIDKDGIFQHLVAMLPALQARALTVELTLGSVRVFGDVAVVHYEGHTRLAMRPAPAHEERRRYTRTWLRTERGWQLIAGMNAPVVSPQSPQSP